MTAVTIHPVILSGGGGTRLWPLSRAALPKQLIALTGETSLLQETMARVQGAPFAAPLVIGNQETRFLVAEQLREAGIAPVEMVLEPVGRNTAPAALVAALLLGEDNGDALILLLPSDHVIADTAGFRQAAEQAASAAKAGWLVTFGIAPDRAETGYGYIQRAEELDGSPGCFRVARFVEKPDAAAAEAYISSGEYAWNSGMFLFSARAMVEQMTKLAPDVVVAGRTAVERATRDLGFLRLDEEAFAASPSVSLDVAVMERTDRAAVLPVDIGWSDVGSWDALWHLCTLDGEDNAKVGDVLAVDTRGSYLHSEGRLLAALGLDGVVVVVTSDAVLICPRDRAQEVRDLVEQLDRAGRDERQHHRRVYRPWGSYQPTDSSEGFQVKRLILNPGASISLQRHRHRSEHWVVVRGTAEVTRGEEVFELRANESTHIPVGTVHRLRNPGEEPLHIVEVQCGDYLGEDDIERFEDVYGRD